MGDSVLAGQHRHEELRLVLSSPAGVSSWYDGTAHSHPHPRTCAQRVRPIITGKALKRLLKCLHFVNKWVHISCATFCSVVCVLQQHNLCVLLFTHRANVVCVLQQGHLCVLLPAHRGIVVCVCYSETTCVCYCLHTEGSWCVCYSMAPVRVTVYTPSECGTCSSHIAYLKIRKWLFKLCASYP